jgi:CheY-like chemotaxis protein
MSGPAERRPALVVDDDPNMQRWVGAVLQPAGYQVVTAADAVSALMLVRSSLPELIVLDLGLPAGGGHSFLERLRKLASFQQTPVIVLSGKVTPEARRQLTPLGVTAFLEKPITPQAFLKAVREVNATAGGAEASPG